MVLGSLLQDVRFALRLMRRNRTFAAVAVLTLALGIGANTAVFSLFDAVVRHPLPYPEPERLSMLWAVEGASQRPLRAAYSDFEEWQAHVHSFAAMAAFRGTSFTVTGGQRAEAVVAIACTPRLFETFGVAPALGHGFEDVDGSRVAVISDRLWVRRFAADPKIVGKPILLDRQPFTVLAVLPRTFQFAPRRNSEPDVFVPIDRGAPRARSVVNVLARLRPGVTHEQAQAEMTAVASRMARTHGERDPRQGVLVDPLHRYVVQDSRATAVLLLGAVAFLLLIACANVANLLLAEGAGREREVAIRVAIGASAGRLVRQMLTESVLLAFIGAALGTVLAYVALPLLAGMAPGGTSFFTRVRDNGLHINAAVLSFTIVATLAAALLFGLVPAINSTRSISRSTAAFGSRRLSGALIVSEVALSFVLLAGAALMLNSLWRLLSIDPGFRADNLLTMGTSLPDVTYRTNAERATYYASALERLSSVPGVESAAAVASLPFTRDPGAVESFQIDPDERRGRAAFNQVSAGYFRTMGIAFVQGREFSAADRAGAPLVAVVNRSMARRYFGTESAIGKTIVVDAGDEPVAGGQSERAGPRRAEIVGVVADNRHLGLDDDRSRPTVFLSFTQRPPTAMAFVLRTMRRPSPAVIEQASAQIARIDPDVPILDIKTMEDLISLDMAPRRFVFGLVALFAVVAVALAAGGIYGVVSHSVERRSREIAVRLAVGARPDEVVRLILRQHLSWALGGIGLGAIGASVLVRLLTTQLFGVVSLHIPTFLEAAVALLCVGLGANLAPALRATRIAPGSALRCE